MNEKIIRTPTFAKGGITEEEKVLLKEHTDKWIKNILRTTPSDFSKLKPAIEGLYAAANLEKPIVALTRSPIQAVFMFGAASALLKKSEGSNAENIVNKVINEFDSIEESSDDIVSKYSKLCNNLAGEEGLVESRKWRNVCQGGAYWSQSDVHITAMRDIIGLRLPEHEKYKYWEEAAIHGTFRLLHEKFCFVSDFPRILKIDDQNLSHGQNSPSHRWSDGWSLYHWHGIAVPKNWIMDTKSLSAKEAITWPNIEQRRAACEILGWVNILKELDAKIIDTDGDPEIGELLEVNLPDIGKEKFLRVRCGTGRDFALPVPPDMKTALQAQSWTWGLNEKDFINPEVRT